MSTESVWTVKAIRLLADTDGWVPPVDIYETEGHDLVLKAELPDMAREDIELAIREVVARRGWDLKALNVRTNHVHAVISARDHTPEAILAQLKSWSTRALREAGLIDPDRPVWTRHGSTRLMWDEASVAAACRYVTDWQEGPRCQSEAREVNGAQR